MARLTIRLTSMQCDELTWIRDTHAKAHFRERAAAVLQVANGSLIKDVARFGLVKRRKADTVGM